MIRALLPALVTSVALAGTEWPEFRGPDRQGRASATGVPLTWSATENVAWTAEVPGTGWSSPVVSKGRVYITSAVETADPAGLQLAVLSYDAASGEKIWQTTALFHEKGTLPSIHNKNGQASPTVVVDPANSRLFAHFGHLGTAALDLTGKVLWKQSSLKYTPIHGNGGSPALVGDTLIFSCDGGSDPFVAGLDARTGEVRWKTPRNTHAKKTFSFATPLATEIDGKMQVILPGSGFVGAYDPASGSELWRVRYGEGYSVVPRPVFEGGMLFIGTGYDSATLIAIKPAGAKGDATETAIAWKITKGAPNTPSVVAHDGHVYFVSDGGIASCAEAATGKVVWNERLGGGFSASPTLAEGRIYFVNEAGLATVVKAAPTFEVLAKNDIGERTLASPAFIDGAIFLRSDGKLRRIGASASR